MWCLPNGDEGDGAGCLWGFPIESPRPESRGKRVFHETMAYWLPVALHCLLEDGISSLIGSCSGLDSRCHTDTS